MTFRLFVDSSNGVDINPEWDFKDGEKKIESRHRARSGREFVYKWGDYKDITMKVSYVSSATMSIVNSWWSSNTELLFMEVGATDVSSVLITNTEKPISQNIKPYRDMFTGQIKLSTY